MNARKVRTMVRVISRVTDTDRRVSFRERAAGASLPWRFFDACTELASHLTYDEDEVIVRRGRPLTRGELGCYSSHTKVWLEFLASEDDQLIVLEDDTLVDWGFLEDVARHNFEANCIQYLRLASTAWPPQIYKGELLGRYVTHYLGYALGSQAYLLTRAGAHKLFQHMREVRGPVDDVMDQTWWGSLPNLGLYQHPVTSYTVPSTIEAQRTAVYSLPSRLRLRRLWFRLQDQVRRRCWKLAMRMGLGPAVFGVNRGGL